MYPYLFENSIGETMLVPTYGLLLAMAFTVSYIDALRRAIAKKQDPKHTEKLFLLLVVGALGGARLFHVLIEGFSYYRKNPKRIMAIWEGGFTFYGGLLASLALVYGYARWQKLSFSATLDGLAPSTILGLAIGRVGCFAAGCCWGTSTKVPWAVTYTHKHTLSQMRHVPVHPVQLYESLGALVLFLYLNHIAKKNSPAGTVALHGLAGYAVLRFIVEYFRGDEYRGFVLGGWLSVSQALSIALLAACTTWSLKNRPTFAPT